MGEVTTGSSAMAEAEQPEEQLTEAERLEQLRKMMNYHIPKNCDMNEEMRQDCIEIVITGIEKYSQNLDVAARMVKEQMDKKYNPEWIVCIGEGFAFEVTHEVKHVLWMYFGGYLAVLVFKAGARQSGALK